MAESPDPTATPTVTDHRPVPRPALPRHLQTWLMAALAFGMLVIIFLTGKPAPSRAPGGRRRRSNRPSAGRVRDYQDRLRALEAQAVQEEQAAALGPRRPPPRRGGAAGEPRRRGSDRRREEAARLREPLRRQRRHEPPAGERTAGRAAGAGRRPRRPSGAPSTPSIDEIADAAVRATARSRAARRWADGQRARRVRRPVPLAPSPLTRPVAADHARAHGAVDRHGAALPGAGRHADRHGADQPPRRRRDGSCRLPRDDAALLAQRPAGPDSRRRPRAGRDEARAGLRRDAPGRRLPSPDPAGRQHVRPEPVPGPQPDRRRRSAGPGQPALPLDLRRRGGRRPDQRLRAVSRRRRVWDRAPAIAPWSSPVGRRTARPRPRCRS